MFTRTRFTLIAASLLTTATLSIAALSSGYGGCPSTRGQGTIDTLQIGDAGTFNSQKAVVRVCLSDGSKFAFVLGTDIGKAWLPLVLSARANGQTVEVDCSGSANVDGYYYVKKIMVTN